MPHPTNLSESELLSQCNTKRTKRSGPGGQHRNKTETAVVLIHTPSGIRAEANERRSQHANLQVALQRLRVLLAIHLRSDESWQLPSELWRNRCVSQRVSINPEHSDFPILLAEALDHLIHHDHDVRAAAESLGITTSQFVKFLKLNPIVWQAVNEQRAKRGLHPLK